MTEKRVTTITIAQFDDYIEKHQDEFYDEDLSEKIFLDEDETRIISYGYYLLIGCLGLKVYPACMYSLDQENEWLPDAAVTVIEDQDDDALYWEAASFMETAIHNYMVIKGENLDADTINKLNIEIILECNERMT